MLVRVLGVVVVRVLMHGPIGMAMRVLVSIGVVLVLMVRIAVSVLVRMRHAVSVGMGMQTLVHHGAAFALLR